MATGITSPNVGTQDLQGDYIRELDMAVRGGRNGPVYVTASLTIAQAADGPSALDTFLACNATAAAIVITAPPAASTKLGTTIKLAKTDSSGNAVEFLAADATLSNGTTSQSNTTQGTSHSFTLALLNAVLTWVIN